MTCVDYYPPREMLPPEPPPRAEEIPVTPEEDAAWIEKLQRMAGCSE